MDFTYVKNFLSVMTIAILFSLSFILPQASAGQVLTVGGVGSSLGFAKVLARAFENNYPGINVKVLPSLGSTGGIKAVTSGAIDLGLSGRPLKKEEAERGASAEAFAMTPFIFVTSKPNVAGLTTEDLIRIYEGKSLTWPDGTRIRLVLRPSGDTDTAIIRSISSDVSRAVDSALGRKGMIMAITNQESDDTVEKTPGSLGATTLAQAITENRSYSVLFFNNIQPVLKNLSNGSYPLSKTFYFVTSEKTSAPAEQFISFVRSPAGISILKEHGSLYIVREEH